MLLVQIREPQVATAPAVAFYGCFSHVSTGLQLGGACLLCVCDAFSSAALPLGYPGLERHLHITACNIEQSGNKSCISAQSPYLVTPLHD